MSCLLFLFFYSFSSLVFPASFSSFDKEMQMRCACACTLGLEYSTCLPLPRMDNRGVVLVKKKGSKFDARLNSSYWKFRNGKREENPHEFIRGGGKYISQSIRMKHGFRRICYTTL